MAIVLKNHFTNDVYNEYILIEKIQPEYVVITRGKIINFLEKHGLPSSFTSNLKFKVLNDKIWLESATIITAFRNKITVIEVISLDRTNDYYKKLVGLFDLYGFDEDYMTDDIDIFWRLNNDGDYDYSLLDTLDFDVRKIENENLYKLKNINYDPDSFTYSNDSKFTISPVEEDEKDNEELFDKLLSGCNFNGSRFTNNVSPDEDDLYGSNNFGNSTRYMNTHQSIYNSVSKEDEEINKPIPESEIEFDDSIIEESNNRTCELFKDDDFMSLLRIFLTNPDVFKTFSGYITNGDVDIKMDNAETIIDNTDYTNDLKLLRSLEFQYGFNFGIGDEVITESLKKFNGHYNLVLRNLLTQKSKLT